MSKSISRPRYIDCEFRYTHLDAKPQMLGGTLLQFGNTYCKAQKKYECSGHVTLKSSFLVGVPA